METSLGRCPRHDSSGSGLKEDTGQAEETMSLGYLWDYHRILPEEREMVSEEHPKCHHMHITLNQRALLTSDIQAVPLFDFAIVIQHHIAPLIAHPD